MKRTREGHVRRGKLLTQGQGRHHLPCHSSPMTPFPSRGNAKALTLAHKTSTICSHHPRFSDLMSLLLYPTDHLDVLQMHQAHSISRPWHWLLPPRKFSSPPYPHGQPPHFLQGLAEMSPF